MGSPLNAAPGCSGGCGITQEMALHLFEYGAFLILKDFPERSEFGIDCRSWAVGPKFLGVKMIPPGVHLLYMSVPGAPRIAFFHEFKPKEIVLRRWDTKNEDLLDCVPSEEELERLRCNIKNIDPNLGAYPYDDYKLWISLSSLITAETLKRLSPTNRLARISSQAPMTSMEEEMEKRLGDRNGLSIVDRDHRVARIRFSDECGLPVMNEEKSSKIRFTPVPQITLADTNLKKAGIDASDRLEKMMQQIGGGDHREVLAEFQFAFVVFLIAQVYEGFDQWKRIIHLLCSCKSALKTHTAFFNEFLMLLHYQIKLVPDDFFTDVLASNNFLAVTLSLFFANVEDSQLPDTTLQTRSKKFRALLERRSNRPFVLSDD